ncbi:MAG: hypothetical protein Q9224_007380, partial [Gallowayella concinna]
MATRLDLDRIIAGFAEMTENIRQLRELDKALKEREVAATAREVTAAAQEKTLRKQEQALEAREKDFTSATEKLVIQATAILVQYSSKNVADQKQQLATASKSPNNLIHSSTEQTAAPKKQPQHHHTQMQRQEYKAEEYTEGTVIFESPEDQRDPPQENSSTSIKIIEQPVSTRSKLDSDMTPTIETSTKMMKSAKRNSMPLSVVEGTEQETRCKRARVDTSSAIPDNSQSQRPRQNVDPTLTH